MDETGLTIAVFGGPTGGTAEVISALEGEGLPVARLIAADGGDGSLLNAQWRGTALPSVPWDQVELDSLDVAVCICSDAVAEVLCPRLLAEDVFILDLSPGACGRETLPAFWPTLNLETLEEHPGGLALPDPVAAAVCEFLSAVHTVCRPERVTTTVLHGASQAGRPGVESLSQQTVALLSHRLPERGSLQGVLAFNLLGGSHRNNEEGDPYEAGAISALRALAPPYIESARFSVVQVPVFSGCGAALVVDVADAMPTVEELEGAVDARSELVRIGSDGTLRDAQEIDHVLVTQLRCEGDGTLRALLFVDDHQR
ncbi:MAG: hypothetical protein VX938_10765, partial [Myxococcota bacterium]|nr:hypothetical protein [Myxococcota bacterium]